MRFGLIFSILLHAIVLGLFIITIKRMPLLNETPDIPVEVTTVAELANVKAASKLQEPKEAPAPAPTPAPPPQQAAPPEEAPPAPAPPLPSETKPKQAPKEQPKPEAEPKARPAPPTAEKQSGPITPAMSSTRTSATEPRRLPSRCGSSWASARRGKCSSPWGTGLCTWEPTSGSAISRRPGRSHGCRV